MVKPSTGLICDDYDSRRDVPLTVGTFLLSCTAPIGSKVFVLEQNRPSGENRGRSEIIGRRGGCENRRRKRSAWETIKDIIPKI